MSVVVLATFQAKDGDERNLLNALRESVPEIHSEAGCDLFALHEEDGGRIILIEKWQTEELLEAHLAAEPVANLVRRIEPFVAADPVVSRLKAVPAGTSSQGSV
ncbi:quinol monooxygenase YgiN [Arthrobacter sp. 1088]|uniref:putative quinol monooxygenase n=1 Tax=Arthrobacter sp. 1088 TaxID=2817768 RepID=UPI0028575D55|nr:antibiotic biosynthesis monooxygenase [Arthrobacter sp. 1088]MDR6685457.1 quinol monooxygenase YgiN [Arthrobacter sp. 1088]